MSVKEEGQCYFNSFTLFAGQGLVLEIGAENYFLETMYCTRLAA